MKNILKRGLSLALAVIMMIGLLPVTAFAAVDSTGKPTNLKDELILAIYTPEGSFPGEPATHGTSDYVSFNSGFSKISSGNFKSSAESELDPSILNDLVQGTGDSSTKVWGVFSAEGLEHYFLDTATIIKPENEAKIIKAVKGNAVANMSDTEILNKYEIIWYVIKLQHSPGIFSFWSTTEWHIDGLIKEKQYYSVNYYGNGNTEGSAPDGTTKLGSDQDYTVLGSSTMKKKIGGVYVDFLGWSAKADGSDNELAFYKAGDVITAEDMREKYNGKLSLYAMWDTTTQYTATVRTYMDDVLSDESDIHDAPRDLYLSTDQEHYYQLSRTGEGVYTTKITGNGKFHLYHKENGVYKQVGNRQLTIYNQDGAMEVYHYGITYDLNANNNAAFEKEPAKAIYYYGDTAVATSEIPIRGGYRFLGWKYNDTLIQPGGEITASVTAPMVLEAQWEKTVNVTVNVTINHEGGGGYDQMEDKDDAFLSLVSRENENSPYLEVPGKVLDLGKDQTAGDKTVTKYSRMFTDLPGGTTDYTVVTTKSGYDTKIEATQNDAGDWTVNVVMTYNPSNFDLQFTVQVDKDVPAQYIPDAAIVKVTFWASDRNQWEIITQQEGSLPGVRVDIDPATRSGSGSYPVWKFESDSETPYGNRIQITSFVYPDGTIVPASNVVTQDIAWTDNVYTATVQDVTGGQTYGTLDGAYYDKASDSQKGTLNAVITMDLHKVTFDAQGGTVNGQAAQVIEEQYKIPGFKDYVPTRAGGYTFAGWYVDQEFTEPAEEGVDLSKDVTFYAKWIEPITIRGDITVAGTYQQGDDTVTVHDIDRATAVYVVLKEVRNGHYYEVDSKQINVTYGEDRNGTAAYSFTGIPNEGKEYHIEVLLLNYSTGYDNEADADETFTAGEYAAVLSGDNVAEVDVHLTFVPPSYDQAMEVDATQIADGFRPSDVLAEVIYRDVGDNHPYQVISQHTVEPKGVQIGLKKGTGSGSQSIWKWHTDGTLYEYQMNITRVDGEQFNSAAAPYYISYTEPTYWDAGTNAPSGVMKATLIPKQYAVTFDLNADTDTVTGMDDFKVDADTSYVDADYAYNKGHTWSFETEFTALPQREGYIFKGWETAVAGVTADDKGNVTIPADVHENVKLTAQWEQITYEVTTSASPENGGTTTGDDTYAYGSQVTVTATANAGYTFLGWYENGTLVSDKQEYSFNIFANHELTAKFSLNQHTVSTAANPKAGGTTTGDGAYDYGKEVTVTAAANAGYTFQGWYENGQKVSDALAYSFTIQANRNLVAEFTLDQHRVTTAASAEVGGTTTGDGTYDYGTSVTVKAEPKSQYTFKGWFEGEKQVSETAEYTFVVEADRTLTAKFEPIVYNVKVQADNGGKAEGTASYNYGDTATVKATVDTTFTFDGWYEGATKVSGDLEYTFTVTSDRDLTAKFIKNGFNIVVDVTEGGTAQGAGYYGEGETATLTAYAQDGYTFVGWFEDGAKISGEETLSFTVEADRTLLAKFANAYTITTIASPDAGGRLTGGGAYESGAKVTITAAANGGYYFVGWYRQDGECITTEKEYTLTADADYTFTAKFQQKVSYKCDDVYLFGYQDTQIGATGPLLRGELAQMIYRLVRQNGEGRATGKVFEDTQGQWFQSGMTYMGVVGALDTSKANGNPYAAVNRGETYKMICLGLKFTNDTELSFSEYAAILRNSGFLSGDGAVTAKIKRYEFCELFNAILGRSDYCLDGFIDTENNEVTAETYGYKDLSPSDGYYRTMMIATSTFEGERIDIASRIQRDTYDYAN